MALRRFIISGTNAGLCLDCVPSAGVFNHPKDRGRVRLNVAGEHRLDVFPAATLCDVLGGEGLPLGGPQASIWVKYTPPELGEFGHLLGPEQPAGCHVASDRLQPVPVRGEQRHIAEFGILGLDRILAETWERALGLLGQELGIEPGDLTIDQQVRFGHTMILAILTLLPERNLPVPG